MKQPVCPYCRDPDTNVRYACSDMIDGHEIYEYRCCRCGLLFIIKDHALPSAR